MPPTDVHVLDDDALIARALAGDTGAFGELVRRHQRAALRVAAVVCGSSEEARDIVQDAFVTAHRALGTYRATGSARSWLLRVVANHARNEVRRRARRLRRDDRYASIQLRTDVGPDDAIQLSMEHEAVVRALVSLRVEDRSVLGCRFVAGLSELETAAVLGIPVGTVKSRTSRAISRLRNAIAGSEAGA